MKLFAGLLVHSLKLWLIRLLTSKCLLGMKLTIILMLAALLQVSAKGYTQTITISVKNASLEKVFAEIKKQTGYSFLYTDQTLQGTYKVDIDVNAVSLEALLDLCLKNQPVSYTIVNKTIILKPKDASPKENATDEQPSLPPTVDISGRITNEEGEPLQGANIKIKGTDKGTTTNGDGVFLLKAVDENATLEISFIGYQTISVSVNNRTSINVSLKLNVIKAPEVTVRKGYYSEKRITTTGNVSTITSKDLEKQPVNNPLLGMQGRVPGMSINQMTGLAGSAVQVQIRGLNSIASGNEPLYVIDGVPYPSLNLPSTVRFLQGTGSNQGSGYSAGSPLSYLNPSDIESIDILKDADATAIYGSRGANGVILITTKKGKQGRIKVEVNAQTGFGKVSRKLDVLNTRQYLDMRYESFKNDQAVPNPNADYDLTLWDTTRQTDWQKELIGGTARYNDIQTAFSGGSEFIQYRVGGGYHKETTVFPGDFSDQKASAQFNLTGLSANKKFSLVFSGLYVNDINRLSSSDFTDQAIKLAPVAPALYNPDGSINWAPNANGVSTWNFDQPIAMTLKRVTSKTNNLLANAALSYKLLPALELKSSFGYNIIQTDDIYISPQAANDPSTWSVKPRASTFVNNKLESWIIEPQISYTRQILKGEVTALFGTTFQQKITKGQQISASGFSSDLVIENIGAATNVTAYAGPEAEYKYNAVFGRINYNRDDKYIINLTGRRDGSSRFGPASQFHNFGAVGAAWVFTKEKFMDGLIPALNFGKLRASYGTTGNDEIGDYSFMDIYGNNPFGVPYQGTQGLLPTRIFTPDLHWEETRKLEAGLDLGFFNQLLNIGLSFYQNRSSNQLMAYPLPSTSGFTSLNKNLDALIQNSGLELEVRSVNLSKKDFQWTSFLNMSANRNKLLSISNYADQYWRNKLGMPISTIFVYRYVGVDFVSGLYQVANESGTPTSNPKATDATVPINYLVPKFFGGLQNTFAWKGLQFDFLIQFVYKTTAKEYWYNYMPGFFGPYYGSNQPTTVLNHWQRAGDVAQVQKFSQNFSTVNAYSNAATSDQLYKQVSYARVKNASISYDLPRAWKDKMHMQSARVFVQGQNLYTLTNYKGLDPETSYGESPHLPPLRVITLGVQIVL
jgi:TonB-dependent starch-binding outer membrane protein SusC